MNRPIDKHTDGHLMEQVVADLLRNYGFTILQQNYKVGHLEIDLIATEGKVLCFIEVKTRRTPIPLSEINEVISRKKRTNLINAADSFCRNNRQIKYEQVRFDYAIVIANGHSPAKVTYYRNAFTPTHPDLQ